MITENKDEPVALREEEKCANPFVWSAIYE